VTVVIGVRISEELKRELEEHEVEYSEDIRRLLEEKLKKKKTEEALKKLAESRAKIGKVKGDLSTQIIRETRDRS
jgi:hypothetical protein